MEGWWTVGWRLWCRARGSNANKAFDLVLCEPRVYLQDNDIVIRRVNPEGLADNPRPIKRQHEWVGEVSEIEIARADDDKGRRKERGRQPKTTDGIL
jgi:hypothetical protein